MNLISTPITSQLPAKIVNGDSCLFTHDIFLFVFFYRNSRNSSIRHVLRQMHFIRFLQKFTDVGVFGKYAVSGVLEALLPLNNMPSLVVFLTQGITNFFKFI